MEREKMTDWSEMLTGGCSKIKTWDFEVFVHLCRVVQAPLIP